MASLLHRISIATLSLISHFRPTSRRFFCFFFRSPINPNPLPRHWKMMPKPTLNMIIKIFFVFCVFFLLTNLSSVCVSVNDELSSAAVILTRTISIFSLCCQPLFDMEWVVSLRKATSMPMSCLRWGNATGSFIDTSAMDFRQNAHHESTPHGGWFVWNWQAHLAGRLCVEINPIFLLLFHRANLSDDPWFHFYYTTQSSPLPLQQHHHHPAWFCIYEFFVSSGFQRLTWNIRLIIKIKYFFLFFPTGWVSVCHSSVVMPAPTWVSSTEIVLQYFFDGKHM